MPDQSTPEINRLRIAAYDDYPSPGPFVRLDLAIQAVRDTEARVRAEKIAALGPSGGRVCPECGLTRWEAKQADGWVAEASAAARREAFREAVEALREADDGLSMWSMIDAAELIERTFLSPDNPEGNA